MKPIDQAFYDLYTGHISQCEPDVVLKFLESQYTDEGQRTFYDKYSWYYSHLMDTYIAFEAGFEYGRKHHNNPTSDSPATRDPTLLS